MRLGFLKLAALFLVHWTVGLSIGDGVHSTNSSSEASTAHAAASQRRLVGKGKVPHKPAPVPNPDIGSAGETGVKALMAPVPTNTVTAKLWAPPWWLKGEIKSVRSDMVFGLFSPGTVKAGDVRLDVISLWWVDGSVGCLFRERAEPATATEQLRSRGLLGMEQCVFPNEVMASPWFKATGSTGFALMPLLLMAKFPRRRWYIVGDEDTMFSPLALAQWLTNFDHTQPWYLGGRSENVASRKNVGWDQPFAGAGIVLSGSFLAEEGASLARCFDVAPWGKAPGGAWVLHRCLVRLGLPLTPSSGFHQMDERDPIFVRRLLEDHPAAPFFSLKRKPWVFRPGTRLDEASFWEAASRDPISFLGGGLCEVRSSRKHNFLAAVAQGLSVRLWPDSKHGILWDHTTSDSVSPPPSLGRRKSVREDSASMLRFIYSRAQFSSPSGSGTTTVTIYLNEKSSAEADQAAAQPQGGSDDQPPEAFQDEPPSTSPRRGGSNPEAAKDTAAPATKRAPAASGGGTVDSGSGHPAAIATAAATAAVTSVPATRAGPVHAGGGNSGRRPGKQQPGSMKKPHPAIPLGIGVGSGGKGGSSGATSAGGPGVTWVGAHTVSVDVVMQEPTPERRRERGSLSNVVQRDDDEFPGLGVKVRDSVSPRRGRHLLLGGGNESDGVSGSHYESVGRKKERRRQLDAAAVHSPFSAIVVVEERRAGQPLQSGAYRGLCHVATHEISFTGKHGDGAPALVLRLRDCLFRTQSPAEASREILGGMTGSGLADLIAAGGGAPNRFSGMRDREYKAPAFPFLNVDNLGAGSSFFEASDARKRTRRRRLGAGWEPLRWSSDGGDVDDDYGSSGRVSVEDDEAPERRDSHFTQTSWDHASPIDQKGTDVEVAKGMKTTLDTTHEEELNVLQEVTYQNNATTLHSQRLLWERKGGHTGPTSSAAATAAAATAAASSSAGGKDGCHYVPWKQKVVCEAEGSSDGGGAAVAKAVAAPSSAKAMSTLVLRQDNGFPESELIAFKMAPSWQSFLEEEHKFASKDIAFGVLTSANTAAARLPLLKLWWLPGTSGCLSIDRRIANSVLRALMPPGLELCDVPPNLAHKTWMNVGQKGRGLHRGALMHVILFRHFPGRKWYVVGDDDTMLNPLALAQWLQNFNPAQAWYLGGRSEDLRSRGTIGWDMAFGGGGIVLSGGFMEQSGLVLEKCFDVAPWSGGPGGDWILSRCLTRLGLSLTANGGFHQIDDHIPAFVRDLLERHPIAPFLSIHHESSVFRGGASVLNRPTFFQSMYRDPVGFLQLSVIEVLSGPNGTPQWTAAIAAGLSVRLWRSGSSHGQAMLWSDQTRAEVVATDDAKLKAGHMAGEVRYVLATDSSDNPLALASSDATLSVTVYALDGTPDAKAMDGEKTPYRFIVVAEERMKHRWVGGVRQLCHSVTYEVQPGAKVSGGAKVLEYNGDHRVLMVGLRDCRSNPKLPPKIISRDSFLALISKACAPAPSILDATTTYRELPAGYAHLGAK